MVRYYRRLQSIEVDWQSVVTQHLRSAEESDTVALLEPEGVVFIEFQNRSQQFVCLLSSVSIGDQALSCFADQILEPDLILSHLRWSSPTVTGHVDRYTWAFLIFHQIFQLIFGQ